MVNKKLIGWGLIILGLGAILIVHIAFLQGFSEGLERALLISHSQFMIGAVLAVGLGVFLKG